MAADEDTELRDLVAQTLEANGVLGKIRAQLRSSVFLALEEQDSLQDKAIFVNKELKNFLGSKDGQLTTCLVREFLEYFRMEFTLAVFDPESGCGKLSRQKLAAECSLSESDKPGKGPLLLALVKDTHTSAVPENLDDGSFVKISRDIDEKDVAKARARFQYYDLDYDGFVSRDELGKLFNDLVPKFPRSMLDAYLNEELRKDENDMIGLNEFIKIYKQILHLCRAVVSDELQTLPTSAPIPKENNSGDSTLERKNKKNKSEISSSDRSSKHNNNSNKATNGIDYQDSEPEEDPFFDDPPLPAEKVDETATKSTKREESARFDQDMKAMDRKLADLGFDAGEDDYDDDFATNSNFSNKLSTRSENNKKSQSVGVGDGDGDEEIDESIEEDILSVEEDDRSDPVEETTDLTVSINEVSGFDYVEDVTAALP